MVRNELEKDSRGKKGLIEYSRLDYVGTNLLTLYISWVFFTVVGLWVAQKCY